MTDPSPASISRGSYLFGMPATEGSTKPRRVPDEPVAMAPGYFELSKRPLHVLVFVLPLVIACEVGTALYLANESGQLTEAVSAYLRVVAFFETFGAFGLYLPALAIVAVLAVQHVLARDSWRVRPGTVGLMAAESAVLATPLLVLGATLELAAAAAASDPGTAASVLDGPWPQRLTVALGAGLYEEFLFRMVLIAAVHLILADLLRLRAAVAAVGCVLVSALAFAAYHDLSAPAGGIDPTRAAFFAIAGAYFAVVYLWRGFGVVVGVHVVYDVIVLLIARPGG